MFRTVGRPDPGVHPAADAFTRGSGYFEGMAGIFSKVSAFARSPQGRKLIKQAQDAAKDPKNRAKVQELSAKLKDPANRAKVQELGKKLRTRASGKDAPADSQPKPTAESAAPSGESPGDAQPKPPAEPLP